MSKLWTVTSDTHMEDSVKFLFKLNECHECMVLLTDSKSITLYLLWALDGVERKHNKWD